MNLHVYNLPVTPHELPRTEALHQMLDNLKYLDDVVNSAFSKITTKIGEQKAKLADYSARIAACQASIARVNANPQKATTVFAPPKYPAPKTLTDFQKLHQDTDPLPLEYINRSQYTISEKDRRKPAEPADASKLFLSLTNMSRHGGVSEAAAKKEGLGKLPAHIASVSSILLYNTNENPYRKYESLDNLEGVAGKDRAHDNKPLVQAPESIVGGELMQVFKGMDFGYKPKMESMPALALPSFLPSLTGVADISFANANAQQPVEHIAPSRAALPDLPTDQFSVKISSPSKPAVFAPGTSGTPPLAKSPAPSSLPAASPASAPIPSSPPPLSAAPTLAAAPAAPAPPPDLPPPLPSADSIGAVAVPPPPTITLDDDTSGGAGKPPPMTGGRGDLLAQIRAGRKLKNAKTTPPPADKGAKSPSAKKAGPGNLMATLQDELARRAKFIRGAKKEQEEEEQESKQKQEEWDV